MIRLFYFAFFIICFNTLSFAGTIDPNTPDERYIEYGSKFHSVVKLCCFDGKGLSCGSAVVIAPNWIITAAHVVEGCHSWTVLIGDEKYNINKMILHKEYKSDIFGYNDIALGYLEKPIELEYYPEIYNDNDEVGKTCSIAGLGFTGNFHTGIKKHDGHKRAGSNIIDKTERGVLICSPSKRQENITELEYLICSGDSGGGLFIKNKLAGINSSVIGYDGKSDSTYGDESCHTRLSLHYQWIKTNIGNTNDEKEKK
jgi:secreted trypsin-like serine protease